MYPVEPGPIGARKRARVESSKPTIGCMPRSSGNTVAGSAIGVAAAANESLRTCTPEETPLACRFQDCAKGDTGTGGGVQLSRVLSTITARDVRITVPPNARA